MTGPAHPDDDIFGPGKLDALLDFSADLNDEDDDDAAVFSLADVAVAAAAAAGTLNLGMEVARASVLGFAEDLARIVLDDGQLQDQLRRHWTINGVSPIVAAQAAESTPLGQLHGQLISVAGPDSGTGATVVPLRYPTAAAPGESEVQGDESPGGVGDNVIEFAALSPRIPRSHAAAGDSPSAAPYRYSRAEWGLEYTQSATRDGGALIEIRFAHLDGRLNIVQVQVNDVDHLLVLRPHQGAHVAKLEVRGGTPWGDGKVRVSQAFPATTLTAQHRELVTDSVRRATIPDRKRWRSIADTLGPTATATEAILEGLR